jgi:hypothetical protein
VKLAEFGKILSEVKEMSESPGFRELFLQDGNEDLEFEYNGIWNSMESSMQEIEKVY